MEISSAEYLHPLLVKAYNTTRKIRVDSAQHNTSFMCGCFGNMCTCIYCVLYCLYCVFVLFRLCIFILIRFVCISVRTTVTE